MRARVPGVVRNHGTILEPSSSFGMTDVMLLGDVVPRPHAFALNYVHTLSTLGPTATLRAFRRISYNALKNYQSTKDFSETYERCRGVPPHLRRRWSSSYPATYLRGAEGVGGEGRREVPPAPPSKGQG